MCGICGYLDDAVQPDEGRAILARMGDAMAHRGPDDEGAVALPGVGLGMRRLSIVDLAGGHQPMAIADARFHIVYNGELYNHRALRGELEGDGARFQTASDTEVVLEAYARWGASALDRFDGMFAVAVWDAWQRRLFLARDRMGEKPLYVWTDGRALAFASEIKALLEYPGVGRRIDAAALECYLTLGFVPGPRTLLDGVRKLPAATTLSAGPGEAPDQARYWDPTFADERPVALRGGTAADLVAELRELLAASCRARLVADVPVGVLLSGGLDSSAVTAFASAASPSPGALETFSVRFAEAELDESSAAADVAAHLGTEHREIVADRCPPELFQRMAWHADEPIADPALIPSLLVFAFARRRVKVVLTGEGADELFGGYAYYEQARRSANLDVVPRAVRRGLVVPAAGAYNALTGRQRYHPRTLWAWSMSSAGRNLAWQAIFTDGDRARFLADGFARPEGVGEAERRYEEVGLGAGSRDWLARSLYLDMKVPLADGLLMKVDKMSMAASIEARAPFLDHRVVEFACRLPTGAKLGAAGESKWILRRAVEGLLPPASVGRRKHGFDTPLRRWLRDDLRAMAADLLDGDRFRDLGIVRVDGLDRLWRDVDAGTPGASRQMWSLLCLAEWVRAYRVGTIA